MPIEIDISRVPEDRQRDSRFTAVVERLHRSFSNPETFNEICIHEGGHLIYLYRAGVIDYEIAGAFIAYDSSDDKFDFAGCTVRAVRWDESVRHRNNMARIRQMAMVGVAGEIAVLAVLRNSSVPADDGDRQSFKAICEKVGITDAECAELWNKAHELVTKDLQNPENQSLVRLAAEEIKHRLLEFFI